MFLPEIMNVLSAWQDTNELNSNELNLQNTSVFVKPQRQLQMEESSKRDHVLQFFLYQSLAVRIIVYVIFVFKRLMVCSFHLQTYGDGIDE
jgi:hypothetical protein